MCFTNIYTNIYTYIIYQLLSVGQDWHNKRLICCICGNLIGGRFGRQILIFLNFSLLAFLCFFSGVHIWYSRSEILLVGGREMERRHHHNLFHNPEVNNLPVKYTGKLTALAICQSTIQVANSFTTCQLTTQLNKQPYYLPISNRRRLSFASLPTGWILYTPKVFTHTYMYMNHAHISIKVHLYYKWLIIKKRLERRNHAADVMWRTQDVSMWGKDVREGRVEGYRDEHINKTYKLSNIKQLLNM